MCGPSPGSELTSSMRSMGLTGSQRSSWLVSGQARLRRGLVRSGTLPGKDLTCHRNFAGHMIMDGCIWHSISRTAPRSPLAGIRATNEGVATARPATASSRMRSVRVSSPSWSGSAISSFAMTGARLRQRQRARRNPRSPGTADECLVGHLWCGQARSEEGTEELPPHSHVHASAGECLDHELARPSPERLFGERSQPAAGSRSSSWKATAPPGRTCAAIRASASAGIPPVHEHQPAHGGIETPIELGCARVALSEAHVTQPKRCARPRATLSAAPSTSTPTTSPSEPTTRPPARQRLPHRCPPQGRAYPARGRSRGRAVRSWL